MTEREPRGPIDAELGQATDPGPPDALAASVMAEIARIDARQSWWARRRRAARGRRIAKAWVRFEAAEHRPQALPTNPGAGTVRTRVLWGVAAVALATGISFFVFGVPRAGDGAEGTIGAARRYANVPDSEVQRFIESDTFDRLMKDGQTRAALHLMFSNDALAEALSEPAVAEALADPGVVQAFRQPGVLAAFGKTLSGAGRLDATKRPPVIDAIRRVLMGTDLNPQVRTDALAALSRPAVMEALGNARVIEALSHEGFVEALSHPGIRHALGQAAFSKALSDADTRASLTSALGAASK